MKKKKNLIVLLLLIFTIHIISQDNGWRYLNHESGGYVTAVYPILYPQGQQPSSINQQVLYARTDIGGIYRSTDNGLSWSFNSCYYRTLERNYPEVTGSDFHIQGVASRFSHRDASGREYDVVVVATGHYFDDHNKPEVNFRSIWRSTNNGNTGTFFESIINTPRGIWFKGNNYTAKIGGECIIYDPNNINGLNSVMYGGGWYPDILQGVPKPCYLYKSTNDGQAWYNNIQGVSTFPSTTHQNDSEPEGIICIYIKPGDNQKIFVGTTHRIVFSLDNGNTWQSRYVTNVTRPHVNRIIFKTSGSNTTVFFTYGTYNSSGNPVTGIGRLRSDNGYNYEALSMPSVSDLLSGLTFGAGDENIIFASSVGGTVLRSTDNGSNWQDIGKLKYLEGGYNQNFIPAHSTEYWRSPHSPNDNNIYHGTSQLVFNPNQGWGSQWYMAGGAGARKTPENGVQNNNLQNSRWLYTVTGQSMPVMYDVSFHNLRFNNVNKPVICMSMSDWTMSWEYEENLIPSPPEWMIPTPLKYDRHRTIVNNYDTYISNVTRVLWNPDDPNLAYCVGGSVYDSIPGEVPYCAGFYQRKDVDGSGNNFIIQRQNPGPFLNIANRAVIDAMIFKTPGNANRIIALVSKSYNDLGGYITPNGTDLGVFYSDSGGASWSAGTFDQPSGDATISTIDAYSGASLPALVNGSMGTLFDGHFTLCNVYNNPNTPSSVIALWLEQSNVPNTGGIFISLNNGNSWSRQQPPQQLVNGGYIGIGSIKPLGNNKFALAVRKGSSNIAGIYIGTVNTTTGTVTWDNGGNSLWNFISADHLDISGNKWAVWGMRTGDKDRQIYKSLDGGNTWSRIPQGYPLPLFAQINSLRIRPSDGSLWIATSGQGVWIYRQFMESGDIDPWIITENTTVDYTDYYPMDIIVRNGATLTFTSNSNHRIDFAPGRRITVETGSRLICNNITFGCPLGEWGGIKLYDTYQCQFDNVTFNNTKTPVEIVNSSEGYTIFRKSFNNCIFNLANDGQYCISAFDLTSLSVSSCQFNMTGSPMAYGIQLDNSFSLAGGAGFGDAPPPIVSLLNNTFTDGLNHLFLNCQLAGVTSFYIYGNTFYRTSGGSGIGLSGTRLTGRFRNNEFSTNQFWKNLTLVDCNLDIYGNKFSGTVNSNIELDVNSYLRLEPLVIDDNYIWYGGFNEITMNNSSVAQNITFSLGSFPATEKGRNCFTLNNNYFNILGEMDANFGRSYYTRYNDWSQGPNFRITQNGEEINVVYLPVTECMPTEELDNYLLYYQIIDLGNGIYDSIPVTTAPGGASPSPDKALFLSAKNKRNQRNYHLAIEDLKLLINQFDSSRYIASALNELFLNYKLTDTTGNQSVRNQLFGELKSYLEEKMNQYQSNFSIADRIYSYYLMCLVMQRQYSQAISGYENIMNNHPNQMSRLHASWDRAAAILAQQQGGSGGGESSEAEELDRKPSDRIAREIYSRETANRERTRKDQKQDNTDEKSRESVDNSYNKKRENLIQSRVSYFNPMNRTHLNEKIKEDLRVINNITVQQSGKENSVPKRFHLHQNYPNPFNPVTKIKYELPKDVNVTITIYDILGREVVRLVNNEYRKAGIYVAEWNAVNFASGVYFYRIEAGSYVNSKKMVLLR